MENTTIQLLQMDNEVLADSRIIAKGIKVEHESFMKTISTYQIELEEFGKVRFEIGASGKTNQPQKYALLNRNQSGIAISFSRNTKEVVRFKVDLFKAIDAMEQRIQNLQAVLAHADATITQLFTFRASHLDLTQLSWECGRWHESYDQLQSLVSKQRQLSPDQKQELASLLQHIDARVQQIETGQTAALKNYRETQRLLCEYLGVKQVSQ